MIRQAHTYLVGALSGVTLIGIAIGVFVVLVSAQVFQELPIVNVSNPDHKPAAISSARALPVGGGATTATTGAGTGKSARPHNGANGGTLAAAPNTNSAGGNQGAAVTESGVIAEATGPTTAVESPSSTGGGTNSSGGNSGSHSSPPASKSPAKSPSSSPDGSGAPSSSGTSGSAGTSGSTGTGSTGSPGTGTGPGTGTTTPTAPVTAGVKSASEELAGGLNETVTGVDENLLGGTLGETGVTETTEEVINGATGSESVVGNTINGVTETVGGLLGSGSE